MKALEEAIFVYDQWPRRQDFHVVPKHMLLEVHHLACTKMMPKVLPPQWKAAESASNM